MCRDIEKRIDDFCLNYDDIVNLLVIDMSTDPNSEEYENELIENNVLFMRTANYPIVKIEYDEKTEYYTYVEMCHWLEEMKNGRS